MWLGRLRQTYKVLFSTVIPLPLTNYCGENKSWGEIDTLLYMSRKQVRRFPPVKDESHTRGLLTGRVVRFLHVQRIQQKGISQLVALSQYLQYSHGPHSCTTSEQQLHQPVKTYGFPPRTFGILLPTHWNHSAVEVSHWYQQLWALKMESWLGRCVLWSWGWVECHD